MIVIRSLIVRSLVAFDVAEFVENVINELWSEVAPNHRSPMMPCQIDLCIFKYHSTTFGELIVFGRANCDALWPFWRAKR